LPAAGRIDAARVDFGKEATVLFQQGVFKNIGYFAT
jgi:hypothetical protein